MLRDLGQVYESAGLPNGFLEYLNTLGSSDFRDGRGFWRIIYPIHGPFPVKISTHVALLRGVNVGGNRSTPMTHLRDLLAKLGFDVVRSLLQNGNLVFQSQGRITDEIEHLLVAETEKRPGVQTDYLVRTASELNEVVAHNLREIPRMWHIDHDDSPPAQFMEPSL